VPKTENHNSVVPTEFINCRFRKGDEPYAAGDTPGVCSRSYRRIRRRHAYRYSSRRAELRRIQCQLDDDDDLPQARRDETLDEINAHLNKTGFQKNFPPQGVEVVSWYVMMGIGQVVTLRFPPAKLRDVNLQIEHGAWGAFRTEFYPTYDYRPVWEASKKEGR
jgi:hypothetical protein